MQATLILMVVLKKACTLPFTNILVQLTIDPQQLYLAVSNSFCEKPRGLHIYTHSSIGMMSANVIFIAIFHCGIFLSFYAVSSQLSQWTTFAARL